MLNKYRAILIDPYAGKISEVELETHSTSAMQAVFAMVGSALLSNPVSNTRTGDQIWVRRLFADDVPWKFLGERYHGKAVITGNMAAQDAVVSLATVKSEVQFLVPAHAG
jgi:hypothetical protein